MPEFVHLNCRSDFSLLEGCTTVEKLIKKAKESGMSAVALTDSGNLFGSARFYKEAKKQGIQPVLGISLDIQTDSAFHNVTLLAQNDKGWHNIQLMSSLGFLESLGEKPSINLEVLEKHSVGVILLSGDEKSRVASLLLKNQLNEAETVARDFARIFPERFYLEIMDHGLPEERKLIALLVDLGKKLSLPLVATNKVIYIEREHAEYQDTLQCIGTGQKKNDLGRTRRGFGEYCFRSAQEMEQLFQKYPEAVENTVKIAASCNVTMLFPGPLLPEFDVPATFDIDQQESTHEDTARVSLYLESLSDEAVAKTHKSYGKKPLNEVSSLVRAQYRKRLNSPVTRYFIYLSHRGLRKRYSTLTKEILDRLDYELGIIILMDFVGYFLIVADFINWAKDNEIPVGPGRGSGAGSLVAYSLRITDLDPLQYLLLFERFLNPERISMPDFDVDFCFERRGEVIDYVTEKYGKDSVGQIITFGTLKPKAAVKDVGRVLGISFNESNFITKFVNDKLVDPETDKPMKLKKMIQATPELKNLYDQGGIYKELFDTACFIEGMNRHASTHAAGIVIGKSHLTDFVPLYKDPKTGGISTQYTMELLEDCGLVKMDFLGLKTLTLVRNTLKLLKKRNIVIKEEEIPTQDEATFKMLCEGKSSMVFQFESFGMRKVLKKSQPKSIEELTALNALYRPGPMANIPQFAESKLGKRSISYPHPDLETILKPTYGVIVYQEQVMEIARKIAGYSLGRADLLRRIMGKKKKYLLPPEKIPFIEGAKKLGYSEKLADEVFELLVPFADYGFNKSHAAAYSVLAYMTAYLKANHPAEFLAANLTNEMANHDKLGEYIEEAKLMDLELAPPHVNLSEKYFAVHEGKIVFGLLGVKNLGDGPVDEILRARESKGPFRDLLDFLERVNNRVIGHKVVEFLILCGAMDGLGPNRATMIHYLPKLLERVLSVKEDQASGQSSLFGDAGEDLPPLRMEEMPEIEKNKRLETEKKLLGFFFSGHPMDEYYKEWESYTSLDLKKVRKADTNKDYQIFGQLKNLRTFATKKGDTMASGVLEDFHGSIQLRMYPKVYERVHESYLEDTIVGLKGRVDFYENEAQFIVNDLELPLSLVSNQAMGVCIRIKPDFYKTSDIMVIHDYLRALTGPAKLAIYLQPKDLKSETRILAPFSLSTSPEDMKKILGQPWCMEVWRANLALE